MFSGKIVLFITFVSMSQKEIDEFNAILKKRLEEVSNSKEAAEQFLKNAGILTAKGNISKRFKGLTRNVPR